MYIRKDRPRKTCPAGQHRHVDGSMPQCHPDRLEFHKPNTGAYRGHIASMAPQSRSRFGEGQEYGGDKEEASDEIASPILREIEQEAEIEAIMEAPGFKEMKPILLDDKRKDFFHSHGIQVWGGEMDEFGEEPYSMIRFKSKNGDVIAERQNGGFYKFSDYRKGHFITFAGPDAVPAVLAKVLGVDIRPQAAVKPNKEKPPTVEKELAGVSKSEAGGT